MNYTWINSLAEAMSSIPEESIVSRTVFDDEKLKVVLFGFDAGQSLSEHSAGQDAVLYFVTGEATVVLGEDSKEAAAGSFVHMPARLKHSVEAKTQVAMLLLLIK